MSGLEITNELIFVLFVGNKIAKEDGNTKVRV
jgi:hypothetical protein